jgi:hypothetical protein
MWQPHVKRRDVQHLHVIHDTTTVFRHYSQTLGVCEVPHRYLAGHPAKRIIV